MPQTAALAEQKALTRRGVDALVEWIATEGLPCPGPVEGVTLTSGPDLRDNFYDIVRRRFPSLHYLTPTTITRALKRDWDCSRWHSGALFGTKFPPQAELRKMCEAKFGPIDWPNDE